LFLRITPEGLPCGSNHRSCTWIPTSGDGHVIRTSIDATARYGSAAVTEVGAMTSSQAITLLARRLHDLRHGAATLAHAAGADLKDIQHMLGHSGIAVTAVTYTMIVPERARDLAEAIAAIVPRARPARPRRRPRRDHGYDAVVQKAPGTAASRAVRTRREPIRPTR
jgi:hypothetical protein